MYELRQLLTFQAVAARQSVTRAAVALGYAQSSVTAQIQALEQDVGVPLFDRIGRRVELTKAGQVMVSYSDRILALANEARSVVGNDRKPSGMLTIGASETLLTHRLPNVISKFQKKHPQVEISVIAAENCEVHAGELRLNSSIDIAFILDLQQHKSRRLVVECLSAEDVLVLVSPGHRLASAKRLNADMLTDEQVLLTERSCGYRVLFERAVSKAGAALNKTLVLPGIEAIKRCASAGMGVAVLPRIAVEKELAQHQLVPLSWPKETIRVYSQMIRHSEKWQSSALVAFWQLAKHMLTSDHLSFKVPQSATLQLKSVGNHRNSNLASPSHNGARRMASGL
jgi:DNA-binding transcriptional LysR family regulator